MKRLTKDAYYLTIADAASKRATCSRRSVGCVIVNADGFIISTGYNGTPPGEAHEPHWHSKEACNAIHAEVNAITNAITNAVTENFHGATAYLTLSPCMHCSRLLVEAGVKRVVFSDLHSSAPFSTTLLKNFDVQVEYQPHILYEDV